MIERAVGLARCPGTCGEWVQGSRNGTPFLIDCPIDRFSEAKVTLKRHASDWILPQHKTKSRLILELLREDLGLSSLGGKVEFLQQLPEGKGMASSTADIVAVAAATLMALGHDPVPNDLARFALSIEPSDSVMFPGITEIAHVQGQYQNPLGPEVPAMFIALDWGGTVDTRLFNARPDLSEHYRRYEHEIQQAYTLACEGIAQGDLEKLAAAGTLSARCNLAVNPKPQFEIFRSWVQQKGGLGIITAHSGTLLAGVFPPALLAGQKIQENFRREVNEKFSPIYLDIFSSHPGGVHANTLDDRQRYMFSGK